MRPNWKRLKYVENRNLFWTHINRIRFNFFLYSIFFWMLWWLGFLDGKWWIGWCTGVKSLVVAEPWISRIVGAFVLRRRNQGKCKLNTCFYIESGQKGSECEMRFSEPLGKSVFGEHRQRIEITYFSNYCDPVRSIANEYILCGQGANVNLSNASPNYPLHIWVLAKY